ncbi:MAG: hypothetical protein KIT27_01050 [Legionellales bacterium]|nr:hypothetical protein [Legionellales bacterium]
MYIQFPPTGYSASFFHFSQKDFAKRHHLPLKDGICNSICNAYLYLVLTKQYSSWSDPSFLSSVKMMLRYEILLAKRGDDPNAVGFIRAGFHPHTHVIRKQQLTRLLKQIPYAIINVKTKQHPHAWAYVQLNDNHCAWLDPNRGETRDTCANIYEAMQNALKERYQVNDQDVVSVIHSL